MRQTKTHAGPNVALVSSFCSVKLAEPNAFCLEKFVSTPFLLNGLQIGFDLVLKYWLLLHAGSPMKGISTPNTIGSLASPFRVCLVSGTKRAQKVITNTEQTYTTIGTTGKRYFQEFS